VLRSVASLCGARDAAHDAVADAAREVHLLRLVEHPNVVRLLASDERSLVLEWCDTDLAQARLRLRTALRHRRRTYAAGGFSSRRCSAGALRRSRTRW
jgi:hypothetical protein